MTYVFLKNYLKRRCQSFEIPHEILGNVISILQVYITSVLLLGGGPSSVVGIATGYGLDGLGFESRWGGEIFRTCPDRPWGPHSLLYNGYRIFPEGKERPGA